MSDSGARPSAPETDADLTPRVIDTLVQSHRQFLAFVARRVGSREVAEDILQEAFVRGIHRAAGIRDAESAPAWFYRVLRNAITDHFRRQAVEQKALATLASVPEPADPPPDAELMDVVCSCVASLVDTLKPEYARAIRRVELDGVSVKAFADEAGITSNNAAVRIHRAREALRRQVARSCGTCATHGCFDCTCGWDRSGGGPGSG
ncbi:MAG TPA: sigma-70 family RNA polymerase sigma factor [Methylomirabilota bacterium]